MDYSQVLSRNIVGLPKSGIRKFFDLLEEMQDVVSLTVGQPDFVTPWHIREAGIESLEMARGLEVRDGEAFLDGAPAEVYDLAGQRVQLLRGGHGVYLVKSKVRLEAPALKVAF